MAGFTAYLRLPLIGATLAMCTPAIAQQASKADPCAVEEDSRDPTAGPDSGHGQPSDSAAACIGQAKKENSSPYGNIPGPNYLIESQPDLGETLVPTMNSKLREQQRLRTAHRINAQGIQSARRGDWAGALRLFEVAAGYAPRDAVILANLKEARIRAAREATERRRQLLER